MTARHEDAVLFALRDECCKLLDEYVKARTESSEARARADADPACPPLAADCKAHWEKHGWPELPG